MLKIVFIGCVQFSKVLLQTLLDRTAAYAHIVGIVTKSKSDMNTDFFDLRSVAQQHGIPCFYADKHDSDCLVQWIEEKAPDVIYCFGWSHLIKSELLRLPRLGVVGYHPAELPRNRGRHPIIWALALGLERTASTFFILDEGPDSGDIVSQEIVRIHNDDDAGSLYKKLLEIAVQQVEEITDRFFKDQVIAVPQNHELANHWRKRRKSDGCIDWRMSSSAIYNLIRALSKPYPGAHCIYEEREVIIWRAKDMGDMDEYRCLEPGKVIESNPDNVMVKCGEGVLGLLEHEFPNLPGKGSYL